MSEADTPSSSPKTVPAGLAGVNIDVSKMSKETREVYEEYRAIVSDDSPIGNEARIRAAEHKLRNAINNDAVNEVLREKEQNSSAPSN